MKRYLVKFSKPLLINFGGKNENYNYKTIYGFIGGYYDSNPELIEKERNNNRDFVLYLCAMSEWSRCDAMFSVNDDKKWVDGDGVEHSWDKWAKSLAEKSRRKLDLKYSTYVIDLDDVNDTCLECALYRGHITCESLINKLIELAEPLDLMEKKMNVFLFNRPIWLRKDSFRGCDDSGHYTIYGVVYERPVNETLLDQVKFYQGYLSMAEECYLNDATPSGYYTVDDEEETYWYKSGIAYTILDEKIKNECQLCREKNNLEISRVIPEVPMKDLRGGLAGDLIVSQEHHETLLDDNKRGCPNSICDDQ